MLLTGTFKEEIKGMAGGDISGPGMGETPQTPRDKGSSGEHRQGPALVHVSIRGRTMQV